MTLVVGRLSIRSNRSPQRTLDMRDPTVRSVYWSVAQDTRTLQPYVQQKYRNPFSTAKLPLRHNKSNINAKHLVKRFFLIDLILATNVQFHSSRITRKIACKTSPKTDFRCF